MNDCDKAGNVDLKFMLFKTDQLLQHVPQLLPQSLLRGLLKVTGLKLVTWSPALSLATNQSQSMHRGF